MNKIVLASSVDCTGCGVCADACPKSCITMETTASIHSYPRIDEDICIECGRCRNVCPSINRKVLEGSQQYYMAWHKDRSERLLSTSGGVGYAFFQEAVKRGWHVCGAKMDEEFNLSHCITDKESEIVFYRGSKYLQSKTTGIFKQISSLADQKKHILFIGTPCQVEALIRFLPERNRDYVLTCGIICHGVNSPYVWADFKKWLEKSAKSKLCSYDFRSKFHGWQNKKGGGNLRVAYKFENGKKYDLPSWRNLFHSWFGRHYILRPSCLNCYYRKEIRNSDITIGDFWGINRIVSGVDTYSGVSAIITTSSKGDEFVKSCSFICSEKVEADKARSVLKGFEEKKPEEARLKEINRAVSFEKEYISNGFDFMRKKYCTQTILKRFLSSLKKKLHLK